MTTELNLRESVIKKTKEKEKGFYSQKQRLKKGKVAIGNRWQPCGRATSVVIKRGK